MHNDSEYSLWPTSPVKGFLEIGHLKEGERKDNKGEYLRDTRLSEIRLKYLYKDSFCKGKLYDVWVCWVWVGGINEDVLRQLLIKLTYVEYFLIFSVIRIFAPLFRKSIVCCVSNGVFFSCMK